MNTPTTTTTHYAHTPWPTRLCKTLSLTLLGTGALYGLTQALPDTFMVLAVVALLTTLLGFLLEGMEAGLLKLAKGLPKPLSTLMQRYATLRRGLALSSLLIVSLLVLILATAIWLPFWGKQFKSLANSLPQYVRQCHIGWQHLSHKLEDHPVLAPLHITVTSSLKELQADGPGAKDDVLGETVLAIATAPKETPEALAAQSPDTPPTETTTPTSTTTSQPSPSNPSTPPATAASADNSSLAIDTTPIENLPYPPGFFQRILLNSFQQVASIVTASFSGMIYGLVAMVLVIFLLMEPRLIPHFINTHLPHRWQPACRLSWQAGQSLMAYTVIGQVITAGLSGLALFALYSLLGVDYPIILSVLFALCTLVPAVGAWFGAVPNCIVLLASGHGEGLVAVAAALLLIYAIKTILWKPARVVEGITLPLKLNPLLLVLSFLVCWHWLGPVGVVAVTPLAVLISSGITLWKYRLTHG